MTRSCAAAKAGIAALRRKYIGAQTAGNATDVAALYSDSAATDIYGLPKLRGRASIEAAFKADYAARKYTLSEITPIETSVRTSNDGSEIGTYHDLHDAKGKVDHEWGRYLVAAARGADGQWRLDYIMVFPDSVRQEAAGTGRPGRTP
jgi:ketosteroid isomerase-like protein